MKPEILKIKNIGPFAGTHTIDFTVLDSIFLVCGKTGAGKTTIFDAISYIFFSRPIGGRAQIMRSLRSQFAEENEISEAELTFSIGASRYKILRQLPFLKPGKKNEIPEEVLLFEWKSGKWNNLTSTKKETDEKIKNIIKLTEKEFSRIVLLPQGEFANFLKENSNQKKETLSELFPISKYSDIMQLAKEMQKEKSSKINFIKTALENIQSKFNLETYSLKKEGLEKEIAAIKKNYSQAADKIKIKTAELEQSKILNQKEEEHKIVLEQLSELESQAVEVEGFQNKIEKARRALSLSGQAEMINKLTSSITENKIETDKKIKELNSVTEILKSLKNEEAVIEDEKIKTAELRKNLDSLERAASVYSEIVEKQTEQKLNKEQKKEIESKLKQAEESEIDFTKEILELQSVIEETDLRKANSDKAEMSLNYFKRLSELAERKHSAKERHLKFVAAAENSRRNLELIIKDYEIEKEILAELKKQKTAEELNRKAAAIAVNLEEGSPCPVCGSTHHPKPAVKSGESLFTLEEKIQKSERIIEILSVKKETEDKNYTELKKDAERYKDEIDETENYFLKLNGEFLNEDFIFSEIPKVEEIKLFITETAKTSEKAFLSLKEAQIANTKKNNLQKELEKIRNEKEALTSALTAVAVKEAGIQSTLKEKQKQYDAAFTELNSEIRKSNIEDTIENCRNLISLNDRKINGYAERVAENRLKHGKLETAIIQIQEQMKKDEAALFKKTEELNGSLEKKGFNSLEELFASILKEEEINELENEVKEFTEKRIALRQASLTLEAELKNKEIKSIEKIANEIQSLQKNIDEEQVRAAEFIKELTLITGHFEEYKKYSQELKIACEDSRLITELSDNLNGENKFKLKFDIWMLSAFLREITVYANRRLEKMSGGRYILKVSGEVSGNNLSGLDLEIYDAYTGGTRPTASLSGGETFMVSISLALGLADSIQNRSGGIKLDSMFIDEGFGTLDEASLENAIAILDEIRGSRMVGIISHVSELKRRIPKKIEIEKTSKGSRIL
ncbi:AAA family ATPase [Treponema pedis]|uniref:Nuclease SbcCD, C subunit n=3 Tax=Treponema pedis TaxID=409322 RepID=S5ZU49_9SPIR|nr:AAA family ATPase [Treponema pedis]AGT43695.1 nuclease SbcCD, C subunit [Treponema pedis str. T A4]